MRVVAIVLPSLALEVVRLVPGAPLEGEPRPARAVVLASRPDMDESSLTGNVRIHAVCEKARAAGILPGQTIAAARARLASLTVGLVTEEALVRALERLAESSLAFGATVAFARGTAGDDTVWVDVTGCAHLFADPRPHEPGVEPAELTGEARLLERLEGMVRASGHACRLALAGGPRVARSIATALVGTSTSHLLVPHGRDHEALSELPIEGLPLDEPTVRTLRRLGLRTARDLLTLPRKALGARLGTEAARLLPLLEGDDRTPLTPYVPPKCPSETIELEYGTDSLEALGFVVATLTSRLASRLEGRGVGVTKLSLVLELDARARPDDTLPAGPRPRRTRRTLTLTLPVPMSNPKEMRVLLRTRLERTMLPAPVLALTLRADEHAPRPEVPRSLFEPESREARALPLLVAELCTELGEASVGKLTLGDSWSPSERSTLVPFFAKVPARPAYDPGPSLSPQASPEPSCLLPEPMPVSRRLVVPFRFVARYESLVWWREPSGPRDVVAATVEGRPAWVELDKTLGAARVLGWLD
ncbi:MAG: DNA polymerase Y family protein [Polyangiaceae bacterium]